MGFSDTWHRTLVYFGLAEDREAYDDDYQEPDPRDSEAELESRYRERLISAPETGGVELF